MGSGKTTLGKRLANKLTIPFFDTDLEIEKKLGKTVIEIFKTDEESRFREMESEILKQLKAKPALIATGGGLPCFGNNMQVLNQMGTTIYLQLSEKALYSRLKLQRTNRPLIANLSDKELMEFIHLKLTERESVYMQSKIIVDVLKLPLTALVNNIKEIAP